MTTNPFKNKRKKVVLTPDGLEHDSMEAARLHELQGVVGSFVIPERAEGRIEAVAQGILNNGPRILAILRGIDRKPREKKPKTAGKAKSKPGVAAGGPNV